MGITSNIYAKTLSKNSINMSKSTLNHRRMILRKHSDRTSNSVKSISYATIRPTIDIRGERKSDMHIRLVSTAVTQILYFVAFADFCL